MAGLNKVTVDDIDVKGKKVLVRVDFNVPMKDGVITNDNRIQAALPTIKKLVSEGGKVILCSHLGKPKNGPEAKFSLKAAAERLAELVAPTGRRNHRSGKHQIPWCRRNQERRRIQQGTRFPRRCICNGCIR